MNELICWPGESSSESHQFIPGQYIAASHPSHRVYGIPSKVHMLHRRIIECLSRLTEIAMIVINTDNAIDVVSSFH